VYPKSCTTAEKDVTLGTLIQGKQNSRFVTKGVFLKTEIDTGGAVLSKN